MKKLAPLLVSHGLALGAGWLAFRGPEITANPENAPAARLTKKPRPPDDAEGRRVLAEMRQGWGTESRTPPGMPAWESAQATLEKVMAAMNERIAGIASLPDERLQSLAWQAALKGMANRGEDRFHGILARADLPADVRPAALQSFAEISDPAIQAELREWLQRQPATR